MTDPDEVLREMQKLRAEVIKIEGRVESFHDTMSAELRPVIRLYAGNGKPSLEARLYHMEKEVSSQTNSTRWAVRTALAGLAGALVSLLWSIIRLG